MQASDIGILCSHEEGFSNLLLEYMASGSVVATDVGGNKEAVKDGWCGYIVLPKKPEKLSEAILKIYTSKQRAVFGMRARKEQESISLLINALTNMKIFIKNKFQLKVNKSENLCVVLLGLLIIRSKE